MTAAVPDSTAAAVQDHYQNHHEGQKSQEVAQPPEPWAPLSRRDAGGGVGGVPAEEVEALDDDAEKKQQGDGRDERGQQILVPGEGDDLGVRGEDALIHLPDERED